MSLINKYNQSAAIELPYMANEINYKPGGRPLRFRMLSGPCRRCETHIENPRGSITEYTHCIEFDYIGVCPECGAATRYHFRLYPKDRYILQSTSDGWKELAVAPRKKFQLAKVARRGFYKIIQLLTVFK